VTQGYTEFELDLPKALLRELTNVLDNLLPAPLTATAVADLPKHQGVYQLLLQNEDGVEVIYIGKTDAGSGLRERLQKHYKKIQHRHGLDREKVFFKAVRVFVFTAVDLEALLIGAEKKKAKALWNGSGFGAKDPGKERDTTKYKPEHFDTWYPIDIDRSLDDDFPIEGQAATIVQALKKQLPYVFRIQGSDEGRGAHLDLTSCKVHLSGPLTARSVLRQVIQQLPPGWQATKLPSHVIMYKDDSRKFPSGELIRLSGQR
jgi:hypothetical protein